MLLFELSGDHEQTFVIIGVNYRRHFKAAQEKFRGTEWIGNENGCDVVRNIEQ
jgi:hypothetical protein